MALCLMSDIVPRIIMFSRVEEHVFIYSLKWQSDFIIWNDGQNWPNYTFLVSMDMLK